MALAACSGTEKRNDSIPLEDDAGGRRRDARVDEEEPPPPDSGRAPGRVYGHSESTLYLFEPGTNKLTTIGQFDCYDPADEVIDIAVSRTGEIYATTFERFLRIDPLTAKCTLIADLPASETRSYPNSLSFVPGPAKEILVGYAQRGSVVDEYVEIDITTGEMIHRGDLNPPNAMTLYESSGDIISLIRDNNRTYATIKLAGGGGGTDLLAEIDPADGHVKQVIGNTNETEIFGLGYWGGKGYGFTNSGRLVAIDMNNGSSSLVLTLTEDGGPAIRWYGAGVTTDAPTTP